MLLSCAEWGVPCGLGMDDAGDPEGVRRGPGLEAQVIQSLGLLGLLCGCLCWELVLALP